MKKKKMLSTAIIGCAIIAAILIIGTFTLGNKAGSDTEDAVRNVSLLYLSELAGRREQVVSAVLDDYIRDLDTALGMITQEDLVSIDHLKTYQIKIKQLYEIANLLSNGVKYTESGSVTLDVKCSEFDFEKNRVKIIVSVIDTGIGIRPEDMEKLFTPFDRLDISHTRNIEGSGLGLPISRELVQLMGSELTAASEYGKGSKFSFEIWQGITNAEQIGYFDPSMKECDAIAESNDQEIFTAVGKRILVVDDTPMNLQVITGLLKRTKMIVDTATTGEECIELFGRRSYDIVLMDYRMPGLNGIETLKKLKEIYPEKAERVPIIALTASAILGDREKLINAGFTDYLSKPVNIADTEKMLRKYVSGELEKNAVLPLSEIPADTLQAIKEITELDHVKGIEYCGEFDDYLFALETYADEVSEKADKLEKLVSQRNYEEYALVMHSLKSMSKSIGAIALSEMAKELELFARAGDTEKVKKGTEIFMEKYRELGRKIKNIVL